VDWFGGGLTIQLQTDFELSDFQAQLLEQPLLFQNDDD